MLDLTFNKVPSQTLYNLNYVIGSRWIFFIKLKLSLKQIMKIGSNRDSNHNYHMFPSYQSVRKTKSDTYFTIYQTIFRILHHL